MSDKIAALRHEMLSQMPFVPNAQQASLTMALTTFAVMRNARDAFVLNGYAGTGKTSVVGALVRGMAALKMPVVILAPTGRAAKVAASLSGRDAFTIHKRIFRGNSLDPGNTDFFLAENRDRDTLFIVDEASLVTDSGGQGHSLLMQLVRHVYSSPGCNILFVGDIAQLPPVGMAESPAMDAGRLKTIGLNPIEYTLDLPVRQSAGSGILENATLVRHALFSGIDPDLFEMYVSDCNDVEVITSSDLADRLSDSWREVGMEETLIVTRSNRRANNFNMAVRNMVLYADEPLQQGDRIVISKNDYYWSRVNKLKHFIANGDIAEVKWVGKNEKMYGRWFTEVELQFPDVETPVSAKIMLRSLAADGASLPREEMERLYSRVMAEAEGSLSQKMKAVGEDGYYNALQVKYAYCVTCHKAQGGQWKHVYVDMGAIAKEAIGPDFFRWLYTALTRATEKVFLINPTVRVV